jgi:hypothetical protein
MTLLDIDQAERATAIAARGPGIALAESLGIEAAPIGAALERLCTFVEHFDRLRALQFAASDMRLACSTARGLAQGGKLRDFQRQLETALVVIYARPYLPSNGLRLGGRWRPVRPADRELHDRIVDELRDPYHAHADRTRYRTLIDMSDEHGPDARFTESWSIIGKDFVPQVAVLANRQAARFEGASRKLTAELKDYRVHFLPYRARL